MKTVQRKRVSVLGLLLCFLVAGVCVFALRGMPAYADEPQETIEQECARLTTSDSFIAQGKDFTIKEFGDRLSSGYYAEHVPDGEARQKELGACMNALFPQRLLYSEREYGYVGLEYSFGLISYSVPNEPHHVDIFLIDNTYTFDEAHGVLTVRAENVAAWCLGYSEYNGEIIWVDRGASLTEWYFKDVYMGALVENEHALNTNDENYNKVTDPGSVIRQERINYGGVKIRDNSWNLVPITNFFIGQAIAAIPKSASGASGIKQLWTALRFCEAIREIYVNENEDIEQDVEKDIGEECTKQAQIENPKEEKLSKWGAISPSPRNDLYIDDYVQASFLLDDLSEPTNAVLGASYTVGYQSAGSFHALSVPATKETLEENFSGKEKLLYGNKTYVASFGDNEGYNRNAQSVQRWNFTAPFNGLFNFSLTDGWAVIKDNNTVLGQGEQVQEALESGKTYTIEVTGVSSRNYVLNVDIDAVQGAVGSVDVPFTTQQEKYVKFIAPRDAKYEISAEENVTLTLYDENLQLKDSPYNLQAGQKVYIKVHRETAHVQTISVTIEARRTLTLHCSAYPDGTKIIPHAPEDVSLPTTFKGYKFYGWYRDSSYSGTPVTNEILATEEYFNLDLYAHVEKIPYTITFDTQGTGSQSPITYYVTSHILLPEPTDDAKLFLGWYSNAACEGESVSFIPEGTTGNMTLYARWVNKIYTVTLDGNKAAAGKQNVALAQNSKTVEYRQSFTLPQPSVPGYSFLGWKLNGEYVTNASGESFAPFEFKENITLIAEWSRDTYTIKIVSDGAETKWLIEGGISETEANIPYSVGICPNCMIIQMRENDPMLMYRPGYKYEHLCVNDSDVSVFCWAQKPEQWVNGATYTVYAYYTPEVYTVYFSGDEVSPKEYHYGAAVTFPSKSGYRPSFKNSATKESVEWTHIPDLSVNKEGNASIQITVTYTPIQYTITYEYGFDAPETEQYPRNATYTVEDEVILLANVARTGYTFTGWYISLNGETKVASIPKDSTGDRTFYAHYEINSYTVTFEAVEYGYPSTSPYATYTVKYEDEFTAPTIQSSWEKVGHTSFWCEIDSNYHVDLQSKQTYQMPARNMRFVLRQLANKYTITLNGGTNAIQRTFTITYGQKIQLPVATRDNYTFLGWYEPRKNTSEPGPTQPRVTDAQGNMINPWSYDKDMTLYGEFLSNKYYLQGISKSGPQKVTDDEWVYYDISGYEGYYKKYYNYGFRKLKVELSLSIREINDGYQHIFLYNLKNGSRVELWSTTVEHPDGQPSTTYSFTFEVALTQDFGDDLQLGFVASGKWSDTWEWRNLSCDIYAAP